MVERHFVSLFDLVDTPLIRRLPETDVIAFTSDVPLPLFSGAIAPRFAAGGERERTEAVLDALVANGSPFQWWMGPLTFSTTVAEVLVARGLVSDGPTPGMHCVLGDWVAPRPADGVVVRSCRTPDEWLRANEVFVEAFELPADLASTFVDVWRGVAGTVQLAAELDGEQVGCAAGVALDGVLGVYNVGVLPAARRRGVGAAVTSALVERGVELGCHSAILHATTLGFPVYEGIGFTHVTDVHQYVWLPPGDPEAQRP
jgi:GNAT superfamily N-acetyltransferase